MRSELLDGVLYNLGTSEDRKRVGAKRFAVAFRKLCDEAEDLLEFEL